MVIYLPKSDAVLKAFLETIIVRLTTPDLTPNPSPARRAVSRAGFLEFYIAWVRGAGLRWVGLCLIRNTIERDLIDLQNPTLPSPALSQGVPKQSPTGHDLPAGAGEGSRPLRGRRVR